MRIPDLADAAIFVELEGTSPTEFSIGCWLSVYDETKAAQAKAPAKKAFERVKAAMR